MARLQLINSIHRTHEHFLWVCAVHCIESCCSLPLPFVCTQVWHTATAMAQPNKMPVCAHKSWIMDGCQLKIHIPWQIFIFHSLLISPKMQNENWLTFNLDSYQNDSECFLFVCNSTGLDYACSVNDPWTFKCFPSLRKEFIQVKNKQNKANRGN